MKYQDMTIEVSELTRTLTEDGRTVGHFNVRVLDSPAGGMKSKEATPVEYDERELQTALLRLDKRRLDRTGLVALGRELARLLLPPRQGQATGDVRGLVAGSLLVLGSDVGLRLQLRLPAELAAWPWEYVYLDRASGGDGMDGFLALDPRIAIVRHEVLPGPANLSTAAGTIQVVAAFASPSNLPLLDLEQEEANLKATLNGQAGIECAILRNATLADVQSKIQAGAAVFHFAGHGAFTNDQMTEIPGVYAGEGLLAFQDKRVTAEDLLINLRSNGIRLAVLAGCETGRRDGVNVWSGVAPALVKAGILAVVANQFSIGDDCAIAFSQQFYRALVGGLPIERAVTAGRIAAYNADTTGRDWGVSVLYLRADSGQLFAGADDPAVREQARAGAKATVNVRVKEVAAGGEVLGAKIHDLPAGQVGIAVGADTVQGKVVGAAVERMEHGHLKVAVNVNTVGQGGKVTGAVIG